MARASGGGRKPGKDLLAPLADALTEIPPPDELLDDNARAVWHTQSRVLIERKLLTIDQAPILLAYCNSFALMLKADLIIQREGLTVYTASGGEKKHPALNARNDAISSLTRIGSLLGFDPTSYRRIMGGSDKSSSGDNEFSEF